MFNSTSVIHKLFSRTLKQQILKTSFQHEIILSILWPRKHKALRIEKITVVVTLETYFREVPGSNISWIIFYAQAASIVVDQ
jgi:hypothetical protein